MTGVSYAIAVERAARIGALRYELRLTVPFDREQAVEGTMTVDFTLTDASSPLLLDFAPGPHGRLKGCLINGQAIEPAHEPGRLVIPAQSLVRGANAIVCSFVSGDGPLNRRDDYLYTIFVPARAHEAFPCFDQPDLKAVWSLTLDVPAAWQAVSNTHAIDGVGRSSGQASGEALRRVVRFADTERLPPYLFAFAAGRFDSYAAERGGRRFSVHHRVTDSALLAANLDVIVEAHAAAVEWLEGYTAIPCPFPTFDIVLIPAFQFGGMEHPGAIFYDERALLLGDTATRQQELARAHVIAHETAHLWFGDLVTMRWFDDVWVKEVFANLMAARIVNPMFPEFDHESLFLHGHHPGAYDVDRSSGTHAIRQPLAHLGDAASLYGPIIYLKSPVVMRQLELLIGAAPLQSALREYLSTYAYANASWTDLVTILARHTDHDLARWSHDWIDTAGRPAIAVDLHEEAGTVARGALSTHDAVPGRAIGWPQFVDVTIGRGAQLERTSVWLDGEADIGGLEGRPVPDFVLPSGRGMAYGEMRLDARSRDWLARHLPDIDDGLTRGSAWLALWDGMLAGAFDAGTLTDLALRRVAAETSELNLHRVLADLQRMFWVFHDADARSALAPRLEAVLRETLERAPSRRVAAELFAAIRGMTLTEAGVTWLRAACRGEAVVPGLALGEIDRAELTRELAVRNPAGAANLVAEQLARLHDRDVRDALAFVAPALSGDPHVRRQYLDDLGQPARREPERWVIDAARWLHHPLRGRHAIDLVQPSLDLLDAFQRTGDIFLPRRWAEAVLGRQGSPEAAAAVQGWLDTRRADWSPALRRVVLASADYLFRAAIRPRT